jgi:uncharacterized membrane protein YtjA (UPF0391 family)
VVSRMLQFAVVFLVLGLFILGFGGIAGVSFALAKVLFALFLGLSAALVFLGSGVARGLTDQ